LKCIRGNDGVAYTNHGALIGGFITLDELSRLPLIRGRYPVLAEASESVGTPRSATPARSPSNVRQRPWCWYYRNGFPCFNNGGNRCFSVGGENQFTPFLAAAALAKPLSKVRTLWPKTPIMRL